MSHRHKVQSKNRYITLSTGEGSGANKKVVKFDRMLGDPAQPARFLPYSSGVSKPRTQALEATRLAPRKGRGSWNGWKAPGPKPKLTKHGAPLRPNLGKKGKTEKKPEGGKAAA